MFFFIDQTRRKYNNFFARFPKYRAKMLVNVGGR